MTCVIDFLNVGFGEATIIRQWHQNRSFCLVVDGGDVDPCKNPRRCSLEHYVDTYNLTHIDVIVITHFHRDHIGGILAILDKVSIGKIIIHLQLPDHLLASELHDESTPILGSLSLYIQIINKAKLLEIPIECIEHPTEIIHEEVTYTFLLPNKDSLEQVRIALHELDLNELPSQYECLDAIDRMLNETAMAVLIHFNDEPLALLTSDVKLDFWKPYEEKIQNIAVVQAPHHGDKYHISKDWLTHVNPNVIIVSADDEGTYQLPHEDIKQMIKQFSTAELYYTESLTTTHRMIRIDAQCRVIELIL